MQEWNVMAVKQLESVHSKPDLFSVENSQVFQKLVNKEGEVHGTTVMNLVKKAEEAHQLSRVEVTKEMRTFDRSDDLKKLIEASHKSAMHSVELQLTGKVGTKLAESFEQIYKQQ